MTEPTLQIGIYKIEDNQILAEVITSIENKKYSLQQLQKYIINGFTLHLFYKKKCFSPKWKAFIGTIVQTSEDIIKSDQSYSEGFVLLLSKDSNIYAVTGGAGFHALQDIVYKDFGMDVFSRLISKDDKILKATKEKSFVGSILGITKYFRKNFNLFENDDFGKIYQELKADIDKDTLVGKFGFTEEDIKKGSVCIAKSSFKISKAISFIQLLKIIKGCDDVLKTAHNFTINNIEKLAKKKNEVLIKKLDNQLYEQLWERYESPQNGFPFDICHHEYEEYLTASYYEVMKNSTKDGDYDLRNLFVDHKFEEPLMDIDTLFEKIKSVEKPPQNKDKFISLIKAIKIFSYDENGTKITYGDLFSHLLGDVSCNNKKYFYVEKNWYEVKDTFISELNNSCRYFIEKNYYEGLTETWDINTKKENDYNQKYIGKPRAIVLDKVTPENIELCDVLYWDDNNLYLCHVKSEFGNTMRDLCAQISIAASRIVRDTNASKEYAKKVYVSLKSRKGSTDPYSNKIGKQTDSITEEQFLELFNKNIVFVLAVLDTAKTERDIKEIERFKSNIAKFSLRILSKEMKMLDGNIGFKIAQIKQSVIFSNEN